MSLSPPQERQELIRRVRAILLTGRQTILFIKRVKADAAPYWVAPGGGVEVYDASLYDTLHRELGEELGATIEVLRPGFVLEHTIADKNLEEHFFVCRLIDFNLGLRSGPEFLDPRRGDYIPDEAPLEADALRRLNIKTPQLLDWLLDNLDWLRAISAGF